MNRTTMNVEGMSCSHCVSAVTKAVSALDGVKNVQVSLEAKTVTVEYDNTLPEAIRAAIDAQGFEVVG